jgi:predicted amidohydrolase
MPSAFAMKTGEAHWETLLRCRAIENQCFVVAAAQVQRHARSACHLVCMIIFQRICSLPHAPLSRQPRAAPDAPIALNVTGGPAQHRREQAVFVGPRDGV